MDQRKIYTDDSDVVFAALHSETIPDDPTLFSSGKDLQLTLRLYPAPESGHFKGGKGAAGLTSASWGNAHEGCAYTVCYSFLSYRFSLTAILVDSRGRLGALKYLAWLYPSDAQSAHGRICSTTGHNHEFSLFLFATFSITLP
jgi:hypothetical protein